MEHAEEIKRIARARVWRQPPEVTLANPRRFIAQVMALGTWGEVQTVMRTFGPDALRDALINAPLGVFDARSWARTGGTISGCQMRHCRNVLWVERGAVLLTPARCGVW